MMLADVIVAGKASIGAIAFAALFIGERAFAASPAPPNAARLFRNAGMWAILLLLSPLIVLPLTKWAAAHAPWTRTPAFVGGAMLLIDIVLLDLWAYFVHRAYHEAPILRRFHRIHHLDERLDTTSAVRFHPGEVAISAGLRIVPVFAFAIPFTHVVIFETLMLVTSLFHHSNLKLPAGLERAISRVIVTPSIHWVHHHAVHADTNSNYAAIFSLWDRLFGTRSPTSRTPDLKIGLEGVEDKSFVTLLLSPFMRATVK